jgi:hypothetical protein
MRGSCSAPIASIYNSTRTHLSLNKDSPDSREVHHPKRGATVVALPVLGGLHHRYERRSSWHA